jgi:hypothetical protein
MLTLIYVHYLYMYVVFISELDSYRLPVISYTIIDAFLQAFIINNK